MRLQKIAKHKQKAKTMKTEAYKDAANVNGKVSKDNIKNGTRKVDGKTVDNLIGGLTVTLPTAAYVREHLSDKGLTQLIHFAGKFVLQHVGSQALRSLDDYTAKYPELVKAWEADQAKPEGEREGLVEPAKPGEPERELWLAEYVTRETQTVSKALLERADAMLKALTMGGETTQAQFAKGAAQYGIAWPVEYTAVTREDCIAYQQAKAAFIADLA